MPKTALITGASRGIGAAIAERLASLGYNLWLLGRAEDALRSVATEAEAKGVRVGIDAGELSDEAFIKSTVVNAQEQLGPIDVLVNNAGQALQQPIQQADVSRWRQVVDLNVNAVVSLSAKLIPGMIERQAGAVIHISSIMGRSTEAGSGIYSATKHAMNGLAGCMYEDVRDAGVKVSTIMPGFVATDMTSGFGMTDEHMIRAEDVADCVEFVLASSAYCCPTEIVLRPQRRP